MKKTLQRRRLSELFAHRIFAKIFARLNVCGADNMNKILIFYRHSFGNLLKLSFRLNLNSDDWLIYDLDVDAACYLM